MLTPMEVQNEIQKNLSAHPWSDRILVLDSVDSTNTCLKTMAEQGAPQGTCLIALEQTGGRGRQGNTFSSPKGQGLYFSVLLRPRCIPQQACHATLMSAVAACDAIKAATGIEVSIKWPNDLVLGTKKLGGILTEMDANWSENSINYIIIGVGINLSQRTHEFPEPLQNIATSLRMHTRKEIDLPQLASAMVRRFSQMSSSLVTEKALWLQRYRNRCVTLGKEVKILRGDSTRYAWALDIDPDGGLMVRYPGRETETVSSGEVSVRGLWGYL